MNLLDKQSVLDVIPANWLDDMLTGPHKVVGDGAAYSARDIERVLQALRARIAALPAMTTCETCGGLVDSTADACHHCG